MTNRGTGYKPNNRGKPAKKTTSVRPSTAGGALSAASGAGSLDHWLLDQAAAGKLGQDIYTYTGDTGGGGGGGGPAFDPNAAARAAEARANARADAERRAAGNRSREQAKNLEGQAKALLHALNVSFAQARDQNLTDIGKVLGEQIDLLKEGHAKRSARFGEIAADTEKATGTQLESAFENLVRERQDTLGNILLQGAGETDALKSMVMAARNWRDNANEAQRAYFDTMRSVNNSLTDLNVDTKSALAGAAQTAESERERIWQDYYNRRSETFTQLGNVRTQQADYYASADEMGVESTSDMEGKRSAGDKAYMDAAKEAGMSYVNKGVPKWIKDWEGTPLIETRNSGSDLAAAMRYEPLQKAEGASLRRWG